MKKVMIPKEVENIVFPKNVSTAKYYGFTLNGKSPGFISASNNLENKVEYFCRFFYYLTTGNTWLAPSNSLNNCIETLLKSQDHAAEVFEFDSYQELFLWGSNK